MFGSPPFHASDKQGVCNMHFRQILQEYVAFCKGKIRQNMQLLITLKQYPFLVLLLFVLSLLLLLFVFFNDGKALKKHNEFDI